MYMLQKRQGDLMRMNAIFIYINTQNFGKTTVSKKIIFFFLMDWHKNNWTKKRELAVMKLLDYSVPMNNIIHIYNFEGGRNKNGQDQGKLLTSNKCPPF